MAERERDSELDMILRHFNISSLYDILHEASADSEFLWELDYYLLYLLNRMGMNIGDQIRYQKAKQRYEQSGGRFMIMMVDMKEIRGFLSFL